MTHRLNRKIALVTAAGQGIGRAISEAFIAEGATVIATDLDPGKLEGLAAARRDKLDVRSAAAVDAFAQQVMQAYGAPDILVNCAGFVHHGTVLDRSEADWTFSFDLNVISIHRMLRAFLPGMVEKRRGAIIRVDAVRQDFIDRQPMGRLGTAQEVAALAVFLASDEASYITGQAHLVDGGMAL
jgi:2-keto-3-deoxy-L-fuconate dehydrogenase